MYWWMGSAMRPRPWYVSAAPFMSPSVSGARTEQAMPIDRAHGNHLHAVGAANLHLDGLTGLAAPQRLVELLLRGHALAVHADDLVATAEPGRPRGAGLVEAVHEHAALLGGGVEPEPGARPPAHHAARADQLVLHGQELLGRDGQAHVGRRAQPQRDDADDTPALVEGGAAAPRGHGRRQHERTVQHVFPEGREAPYAGERGRHVHEVAVLVDAGGAGDRAHLQVLRGGQLGGGPGPSALEANDREAGVE